jgi:hypothetical protein
VLSHSKKLLPLQRDLRGETPLEICAQHGDAESVAAMLQFMKVRKREFLIFNGVEDDACLTWCLFRIQHSSAPLILITKFLFQRYFHFF